MKSVTEILQSEFDTRQMSFRTVSIHHLGELRKELTDWKQKGLITEAFYEQNYGPFHFQIPDEIPGTKSIIIIAARQRYHPLVFQYQGKRYRSLVPPTYVYTPMRNACKKILTTVLKSTGNTVANAALPLKLLAVKSGLARYGRNNICYVDGMGSFVRLEAYFTDYRFPSDDWQDKRMLDRCEGCVRCQKHCPTHCIPSDRFLIHADQCLTYFNENSGPFPSWLDPRLHHAIVGCMRCQEICPQNRSVELSSEHPVVFPEEEVAMILNNTPREKISASLAQKLIDLDIDEYYPLLSRNLAVLLNR